MDIHILCGGESTEHEISLRSAKNIIDNLNKEKYNISSTYITKEGKFVPIGKIEDKLEKPEDLIREAYLTRPESIMQFIDFISQLDDPMIIPVIHGTTGEDGQIQGFIKTLGYRFVGNSIASSAVCFDKSLTNELLELNNIPQAKYFVVTKHRYLRDEEKDSIISNIFDKCGENVYVKPASNGSSIGVSKATRENIIEALDEAFKYDNKVLVEEEMNGVELEISVVGNENPKASLAGSYATEREIFDYTAKYHDKNLVRNVPHKLNITDEKKVRELATDAYVATGCEGFARVDIFMDENHDFFVNEINTFPGMTPSSLSADLWEATDGTSFETLLDELIQLANERI
ncbi:D-alanine--D-alanine ligase family protein [Helcococcus kunzii]|uniref:D-alanine--D-alanine ligase n=1 Tax=Helcococcus kunzii ATCC 51366 TaxID=883114 RepID=H3NLS4_9FIRM|nr:D-alanine--D-alanine ligase family protein [Helcococcus kunzii]EHR35731.1 D-alanine-D-alanine ligase [Helcococcus kunzii ATCC 51366]